MGVNPPVFLLHGLIADDRLFQMQRAAIPELISPAWVPPRPAETLNAYARRFARQLDPGRACFVGGASFGGAVALEMAVHLKARACFLIGGVRCRRELPWYVRFFQPMTALEPEVAAKTVGLMLRCSLLSGLGALSSRRKPLTSADANFLCWATWALLNWRPHPQTRQVPVHHIHGAADRLFPARYTRPDIIVPGGGHLLPVTHPEAVTQFLLDRIRG
jgi:pimeloyl-ACP methyl ester carboxylesterase